MAADAYPLDHIATVLGDADVVVSCTGAVRPVVSLADAHRGLMGRSEKEQLVICDLGMPRDVDPAVAGLPGVFVVDMDRIQRNRRPAPPPPTPTPPARSSPPKLPTTWPDSGWPRSPRPSGCGSGPPTWSRPSCCGWTTGCRDSTPRTATRSPRPCARGRQAAARPDGRVKQLASAPGGDSYAEALRELFELDQHAVDAVAGPELPLVAPDLDKPSNA